MNTEENVVAIIRERYQALKSIGSMRFPVEATRCSGVVSGAKLWKADEVLPLLDC
jgi:hypothetical protein